MKIDLATLKATDGAALEGASIAQVWQAIEDAYRSAHLGHAFLDIALSNLRNAFYAGASAVAEIVMQDINQSKRMAVLMQELHES